MKKYRAIIPVINKEIRFSAPKRSKRSNTKVSRLDNIYDGLVLIESKALYLFLGLLPLSYLFFNDLTEEGSIFLTALIGLVILIAIYISRSSIIGFRNLKEPIGLIPVLTFGLLLSIIALVNDPATA